MACRNPEELSCVMVYTVQPTLVLTRYLLLLQLLIFAARWTLNAATYLVSISGSATFWFFKIFSCTVFAPPESGSLQRQERSTWFNTEQPRLLWSQKKKWRDSRFVSLLCNCISTNVTLTFDRWGSNIRSYFSLLYEKSRNRDRSTTF